MPTLTLQEKLDRIPTNCHVQVFRYSGGKEWYVRWYVRDKPVMYRLGQDHDGLIAEFVRQGAVSKPAPTPALPQRLTCSQHDTIKLWCQDCITVGYERMRQRRA